MKSIVDFLLESKGADLKDRKWMRFFGDQYGKPNEVKQRQWKTKKFLKDYKDDISEDCYDFLMKLNEFSEGKYDSRSELSAFVTKYEDETIYGFDFNIHVNNLSESIEKKLSSEVVSKKFGFELKKNAGLWAPNAGNYSCNSRGFGVTTTLNISYFFGKDKDEFFKVFNYVSETLKEIEKEIFDYYDDYKDKEEVSRRRQEEK